MLRIRLRRMGNRNRPFYRVVVSDSRKTPTASAVEEVGHYNPTSNPPEVQLDAERVRHWMGVGARPSPTVLKLLKSQESGKIWETAEEPAAIAESAAAETSEPVEAESEGAEAAPAAETSEPVEVETAAEAPEPVEAETVAEAPEPVQAGEAAPAAEATQPAEPPAAEEAAEPEAAEKPEASAS